MLVRDVMITEVVTATAETPLTKLVDMMVDHDITGLPVVDAEGHAIGVVTEADLVARLAHPDAPRTKVSALAEVIRGSRNRWGTKAVGLTTGEVMTTPAKTISQDATVRAAAARMMTLGIKRLPVVDGSGVVVGIVSRRDLFLLLHRSDAEVAADAEAALRSPIRSPDEHGVRVVGVDEGIVHVAGWTHTVADAALIDAVLRAIPGVIDIRVDLETAHDER